MSYYYDNRRSGFLANVPEVTRTLIIVNILVFIGTVISERTLNSHVMVSSFALFHPASLYFKIWQPFTYMFMHGGFFHIFFNMYTLLMFGGVVEQIIGPKKFTLLYFLSGLGAAALHLGIMTLTKSVNVPMVGASGAIYGVLIAYAILFPDSRMTLLFPPVTLTAKWMVAIFLGIELFTGVTGTVEGIAHFAHLGGMVAGFLIMFFWKKRGTLFNRDNYS